jgi:hypothetical protein
MPTIAELKQQVDRIWGASFQRDLADTLAAHLRRQALVGVDQVILTMMGVWPDGRISWPH